jgi:hypothetical protein
MFFLPSRANTRAIDFDQHANALDHLEDLSKVAVNIPAPQVLGLRLDGAVGFFDELEYRFQEGAHPLALLRKNWEIDALRD